MKRPHAPPLAERVATRSVMSVASANALIAECNRIVRTERMPVVPAPHDYIETLARENLRLPPIPRNASGARLDGPTIEQWVAAGYRAEAYPPEGYAATRIPCVRGD